LAGFSIFEKTQFQMSREELQSTYSKRNAHFAEAVQKLTRRINLLSLARLLTLVAFIWLLVFGIRSGSFVSYLLPVLMLVLFLAQVNLFNRQNGKRELYSKLLLLNEKELACLDHIFHDLPDGLEYADTSHPWSHDLDIFGSGSLFQYMNRSCTRKGSNKLAAMLSSEPGSAKGIMERQKIISDLKDRIDFRQYFTATGELVKEKPDDLKDIDRWLGNSPYISKYPWLFYLALATSLISVGFILWTISDPSGFLRLLYPLVFNMTVLSPFLLRTQKYQEAISRKHELLEGYARLLKLIAATEFTHLDLQSKSREARKGMQKVVRLSKLMHIFDQRLNMLLGVLLNGFFLFDFIMLHLLERWKKKNQQDILEWIEICGWTDAMISLSGFAWNHPAYCMPEILERSDELQLDGLGHPLIPDQKRIVNDLKISEGKVVIITGANMAGKSTFLRSLGINMVLAYTGCPVCATLFRCSYLSLYSSMRTADSLKDEESYFLAEIKKLHLIVLQMEKGKPMMILLDEVLKGTNTTDKKLGSIGLIRKTLLYPVRLFIATHDLSLGELEKEHPAQVVNYCFESYIKDMELSFDYTMRKGIATNMNASFLMKKMGIVD
jgi:ABC-type multidrug transport system fused ATPase/permease subunit